MSDATEQHAEQIRTQGYTIIENGLDAGTLKKARAALEEVFEREKEIGPERGWHNDVYKVSYVLPQKHAFFRSICMNEKLLPLMREILGENCCLASLNGLTMTPGGKKQALHIDQNETIPGNVMYINALHALDDWTQENGCTRVVPCSQDRPWSRGMDMEPYEAEAVYLEAPAGSIIAYNGGLWHAGSRNGTEKPRRAVHAFFMRPWLRPQWDFTKSLSPEVKEELSEEEKQLFGFYALAGWYDYKTDKQVRGR